MRGGVGPYRLVAVVRYDIRPDDYLRTFVSSILGCLVGLAIAGLDDLMGRPLHWGWPLGVAFVALWLFYALSLVIWRRED